jgi:hypothetical protein
MTTIDPAGYSEAGAHLFTWLADKVLGGAKKAFGWGWTQVGWPGPRIATTRASSRRLMTELEVMKKDRNTRWRLDGNDAWVLAVLINSTVIDAGHPRMLHECTNGGGLCSPMILTYVIDAGHPRMR